jgi:hypothetical protein
MMKDLKHSASIIFEESLIITLSIVLVPVVFVGKAAMVAARWVR